MKFNKTLFKLLSLVSALHASLLHCADEQSNGNVKVYNGEQRIILLVYPEGKETKASYIFPDSYSKPIDFSGLFPKIGFSTSHSLYHIMKDRRKKTIEIKKSEAVQKNGRWQEQLSIPQEMPYKSNEQYTAHINNDGTVSLESAPAATPQPAAEPDGRPTFADFDVYMALGIAANATPQTILGVGKDASKDEIRKAYKAATLKWHPDRNAYPNAGSVFQLINWAYEKLK